MRRGYCTLNADIQGFQVTCAAFKYLLRLQETGAEEKAELLLDVLISFRFLIKFAQERHEFTVCLEYTAELVHKVRYDGGSLIARLFQPEIEFFLRTDFPQVSAERFFRGVVDGVFFPITVFQEKAELHLMRCVHHAPQRFQNLRQTHPPEFQECTAMVFFRLAFFQEQSTSQRFPFIDQRRTGGNPGLLREPD